MGRGRGRQAVGRGWGRRRWESRLLAVHLRADARVLEAALAPVPVAMSRFKVSKFRHTEARLPRREVSPASGPRATALPPNRARVGTLEPACPGAPRTGPASGPPCRGLAGRAWRSLDTGCSVSPGVRPPHPGIPEVAQPARLGPNPEACEAACLPGFRSASLGSRGRDAAGAGCPSPPPCSPLPGAGVWERCASVPWPEESGRACGRGEPLSQRRAPSSRFRWRFLFSGLVQALLLIKLFSSSG